MNPSLEVEIRRHVAFFLAREQSVEAFYDWFVPVTWEIEQTGNPIAQDLAYEIELRFAEYTGGHCTEDDLRRALRPLVTSYTVGPLPAVVTASSSKLHPLDLIYLSGPDDRGFVRASG